MRQHFTSDFLASIVVFLVALPLCMGIAVASGVPPALGIITGIVGGIVVGFIAGSPLQVSGPAAGLAVIVVEIVQDHGLVMLGPILILAGLIQVVAGVLKVGQWFRAISPAVVYGMLAGIGVLIFASQFHVMVDDTPKGSGLNNLLSIPSAIYKGLFPLDGSVHHLAALIGLVTVATMILWGKFRPQRLRLVPAPLVAILLASGVALVLQLPIKYVNVPEKLTDAMTFPTMETLGRMMELPLLLAAVAVAFIASAETLLSAAAVDRMHNGPRTDYDRELTAQGVGNLLCGMAGALPMTGVIVRSSANVQGGAKTRSAAIFHGVWLLLAVLSLPHVLRLIPTAALAAILVYTGYKLVSVENIRQIARYGKIPLAIYGVTVVVIVATDLLTGVLAGIALSIAKLIYKVTHLNVRMVPLRDGYAELHLEGAATFIKLPKIAAALDKVPAGTELHVHAERLAYIDHSCLDLLSNWEKQNESRGSSLVVEWEGLEARYHRPSAIRVPA
jgi:MFS superfamily sulfate permease-like transporter